MLEPNWLSYDCGLAFLKWSKDVFLHHPIDQRFSLFALSRLALQFLMRSTQYQYQRPLESAREDPGD